ncbi:MAG: 2-hydroxyacyl-CoA dehydratase, partial [Firmicutes bacterium]|nr:2-hydroxyacyl-CoA dehydratase [Bacillota bacterium]
MSDYVKMWEDLGMDLETHDQLCQVLPTAFGDVYLSQENRPEGMGFWDFVVSEIHGIRPSELIEAQKNGQKVFGTFCVYVPDEVVIAANGIVTGLCGGSQFWVPGGEKVLPKNTCPLIKASVGARLDRTCPFFRIADMYVGETTCDGKKKAYEILAEDVPVHVMDMPQMKRAEDYDKWAHEIELFAGVVEQQTGNKVTPEKLAEAIKIINNKRKALKRVYDARKADKLPISGKDALLMMQIAFFDDPVRCAEMCNKLADELDQRIKDGVSVFPEGTKRILLTGTPLAIPNWKLHHIIETSG